MFLEREKTIPKQTWLDRLAICTKSGMQERIWHTTKREVAGRRGRGYLCEERMKMKEEARHNPQAKHWHPGTTF